MSFGTVDSYQGKRYTDGKKDFILMGKLRAFNVAYYEAKIQPVNGIEFIGQVTET